MSFRALLRKMFSKSFRPSKRPLTEHLRNLPLNAYFPPPGEPGRPRWAELHTALMASQVKPMEEVWWEVGGFWVQRLAEQLGQLGPDFHLLESYDGFLLSRLPTRRAEFLLRNTETLLQRMTSLLGASAVARSSFGPHIMLCFEDSQELQEYLSILDGEGESAAPAAVFIPGGCGHIVMYGDDLRLIEPTLVHELTHDLLCHRGLPLWFEEGIAQVLPQMVVNSGGLTIDRELHQKQREAWTRHGLREFWEGRAFRCPRQAEHAYALSEVLVRGMLSERLDLQGFLSSAHWQDCGAEASRQHLKNELSTLASSFLGPGIPDLEPPRKVSR